MIERSSKAERASAMLKREVGKWSEAVRKAEAVSADHPGQVLHIVHADLHRDSMAELERIYGFIGMDLEAETRAAMARRIAEKPELHAANIAIASPISA